MWNIQSTTRLLKQMSQATEPGELVRLFFEHIRRDVHVKRALVLNNTRLSRPRYRLVHNVSRTGESTGSVATLDEPREGGLLAEMLYLGKFQSISPFVPDPSDPAFDLLRGSRSLMAFPHFENGSSTGMVVILGSSVQDHDTAEICALATISSLLGRAIETQKLANQLELACRALDKELQAAASVQRWLLPEALPTLPGSSLAASYRTAHYSGGDYYQAVELPGGKLAVFIADVSGHGAAAAVLVAVLRTILHEMNPAQMTSPAGLLDYLHLRLCALGLNLRNAFITAFAGVLDPTNGTFTYSSAGHPSPLLRHCGQSEVTGLDAAKTVPLGIIEPRTHTEEAIRFLPGDLTLFFTDGIVEARSPAGELFDTTRLEVLLRRLPQATTAGAAVEAINQALDVFTGGGPLADDQTLLALRFGAPSP